MRSYLGKFQAATPASSKRLQAMRAAAWQRQGIVVLRPEEIRDAWLRQVIVNEAVRLFGARGTERADARQDPPGGQAAKD